MKHLIAFLTLTFSLFSNEPPEINYYAQAANSRDPLILIDGQVNAVTGDYVVHKNDIFVTGAEPIAFSRHYLSSQANGDDAKWELNDYYKIKSVWYSSKLRIEGMNLNGTTFTLESKASKRACEYTILAAIKEPNGSVLTYEHNRDIGIFPDKKKLEYQPGEFLDKKVSGFPLFMRKDVMKAGLNSTSTDQIGAKYNRINMDVAMYKNGKYLIIETTSGGTRYYKKHPDESQNGKEVKNFTYLLRVEVLPNESRIKYTYNDRLELTRIITTDPSGAHIYAWLNIAYNHENVVITTSDNQRINLHHSDQNKRKVPDRFEYSRKPTDQYIYGSNHRIEEVKVGGARSMRVVYEGNTARVKTLSYLHDDGTYHETRRFEYSPGNIMKTPGKTTMFDADGNKTVYHYSKEFRVEKIEYCKGNTLSHYQTFTWGKTLAQVNQYNEPQEIPCMKKKAFYDAQGKAYFEKEFFYDKKGNIAHEDLCGDLTGKGHSNECQRITRKYSDNIYNLLMYEDDGRTKTSYYYLPKTDRLFAKIVTGGGISLRTFYEYDPNTQLLQKIVTDDGTGGKNGQDLTHVTERHVQVIHRRTQDFLYGMPDTIEELALNGIHYIPLKKIQFSYSRLGKITEKKVYDAEGKYRYSEKMEYDERGRLINKKNAYYTECFAYNAFNEMTYHRAPGEVFEEQNHYDLRGRILSYKKTSGEEVHVENYHYNDRDELIEKFDSCGNATTYHYDAFGNLQEKMDPPITGQRPVACSEYNAAGNPIIKTDARGNKTFTTYTSLNSPISIVHPDGSYEKKRYNVYGDLVEHTDQAGVFTTYTYDRLKRLTSKSIYAASGKLLSKETKCYSSLHLLSETDPEGHTTNYSYDFAGRLIKKERKGRVTCFEYDALGRKTKTIEGDKVTCFEYDFLNRLMKKWIEDEACNLYFSETYAYDPLNNQIEKSVGIQGNKSTEYKIYDGFSRLRCYIDPLGYETRTDYERVIDPYGSTVWRTTTTDPRGVSTLKTKNAHGKLVEVIKKGAEGNTLQREVLHYDLMLNLTQHLHFNPEPIETAYAYDTMNRMQRMVEAKGSSHERATTYTYTPRSMLHQKTKPDGTQLTHTYDALKNRIRLISSDGTIDANYEYDLLGNLIRSSDSHGETTRIYNAHGQVLQETLANGLTLSYAYDARGRKECVQLPDDSYILYTYDPANLNAVIRKDALGHTLYAHHFEVYDLSGNVLKEKSIHGDRIEHEFDPLNRHIKITAQHFSQTAEELDASGRLIRLHTTGPSLQHITQYTYDDLDELIKEEGLFSQDYAYDSLYNRIKKGADTYRINDLNQVETAGTVQYRYDENGNPQTDGKAIFIYDALDRLTTYELPQRLLVRYQYDTSHRRTARSTYTYQNGAWVHQQTFRYLYDGQKDIGTIDEQGYFIELRVLGNSPHAEIGGAVAIEINGMHYAPIHDLLGNTRLLLMHDHTVQEFYEFSAFGEEKTDEPINPWRFSSKCTDNESGLVYFGRRYYSPKLGRFLTTDPKGFSDGPNLYAYVHNEPLLHFDEYGLEDFIQNFQGIHAAFNQRAYPSNIYGPESAFVVSWNSFENSFANKSRTYDLSLENGFKSLQKGRIIHVNGIGTSFGGFQDHLKYLGRLAGGYNINGVYNATHGMAIDGFEYFLNKNHVATTPVGFLHTEWNRFFANANTRTPLMQTCHSQGVAQVRTALMNYPKALRERIIVVAVAPSVFIDRTLCRDVTHYTTKWNRDIVPFIDGKGRIKNHKSVIMLEPHKEAPAFDHDFQSPTYKKVLLKEFTDYIRKYE